MARPMNFRQWWDKVGTASVQVIADELGTTISYLRQLRYGSKKPSGQYAERIISLAEKHTPGFVPDLRLMIKGVPRANAGSDRTIAPSPEFVAAMAKRKPAKSKRAAAR